MIKIFGFPSFTTKDRQSGVDYARITLPMTELNKQWGFRVDIFTPDRDTAWDEVAKNNDIIYFNYLNNPIKFAMMGCMARKYGRKLVIDLDDNIWNILEDNPAHATWHKGSQPIKELGAIMKEVDYITCTNQYLKNAIVHRTGKDPDKVMVFPNRIDLDNIYTWRKPFKDEQTFTMVHFGSTTHFKSILNQEFIQGMDKLMQNYPNIKFKTIGSFLPLFKERWGSRYVSDAGSPDLMTWVKERRKIVLEEADFMVVPLNNNVYNRAKSSIKYLEASSCKLPGCWQDIRQYQEVVRDGYNGFLCKTRKDWYKKMKKLIDDKQLRKSMGEAAFKTVEEGWQMKDNIKPYIDFFGSIV